jgi:multidrug efflux pump subunit AcrA (membrane-fusion protein)
MKIIQTDILELEMVVSSEWISWLTIGHPVNVFIDEIQKEFNASISGIGANVDAVSQTIQLKGTITDVSPALLPGMSGRVIF